MKTLAASGAALAAFLLWAAPSTPGAAETTRAGPVIEITDRVPTLAEVSQSWARNWEAGNLDAVLSLYTSDAIFMDANGSRVSGKAQLRTFFAAVLKQYRAHPVLHSVRSSNSGLLGYDWGDYREVVVPVGQPDWAITTRGTYLVILRNVSGRWLIANQMWTGNKPVPVKK